MYDVDIDDFFVVDGLVVGWINSKVFLVELKCNLVVGNFVLYVGEVLWSFFV